MQRYIEAFMHEVKMGLESVAWKDVAAVSRMLHAANERGGNIYIIGNGGSAAIASHFANDLNKGTLGRFGQKKIRRFRAVSLTDNVSLLTAWANDVGYEWAFAEQLNNLAQPKDVLFAISSSGESPSILHAVVVAKSVGMATIGLCGFSGGRLRDNADESICVKSDRYDVVESVHATITHLLATYFYETL